jgi:RNA polymerase sigma-70 factor (ECF subfamily)
MAVSEAGPAFGREGVQRPVLSYGEFATELDRASRVLWCIAAAIVRDRTEAEDVVQEAAVIGLSKIDQFDPSTSFTAWMGSIVRYVALNQSRRARRRNVALADPAALDAAAGERGGGGGRGAGDGGGEGGRAGVISSDGKLLVDQGAFDDGVLRALSSLDETARACLLLRTLLDLPYRDISLALGIPEGTAMSHVHRARGALRRKLSGSGEEGEAGATRNETARGH